MKIDPTSSRVRDRGARQNGLYNLPLAQELHMARDEGLERRLRQDAEAMSAQILRLVQRRNELLTEADSLSGAADEAGSREG